jgi:hypothetical protein
MTIETVKQLETLSSSPIHSLDDAEEYVLRASTSMWSDPDFLSASRRTRVATAEFAAANEPRKLVPDKNVADAFAFLSREFKMRPSQSVSPKNVHEYRGALAAHFPRLFGQGTPNGVRPVGAAVMLYLMTYSGGIPQGTREMAQQPMPGPPRFDSRSARLELAHATPSELEYQTACRTYFQNISPQQREALVEQLMNILDLP